MRRHEPFVHKVLACQMIAWICSKEIQPHLLQFFLPIGLQRLPCFIVLPPLALFLQHLLVAMTAGKLFCNLTDMLTKLAASSSKASSSNPIWCAVFVLIGSRASVNS